MAGVASALQLQKGQFGFIGGMEIPAVQKFNWGFQQGIAYANEHYSTKIVISPENVIYQGTFHEVAAGQQLAAQMFDKGVSAIFTAAGGRRCRRDQRGKDPGKKPEKLSGLSVLT